MAVINVTPLTNITALIASDSVNEGDVLLLEEGIYTQTVVIQKNNIRIVAKGPRVIFDGNSALITAFTLLNSVGVGIVGITIRHYLEGMVIRGGSNNRIVNIAIRLMSGDGIDVINTSGNLFWKNEICNCSQGMSLSSTSSNNWFIGNTIKECRSSAFGSVATSNNAFVSNKLIRNGGNGLGIPGSNNLMMNNLVIDNVQGIFVFDGSDSLAIGNKLKGAKSVALGVFDGYTNYFAGENHIVCNREEGISNSADFGMFLNNQIAYNGDTGITLASLSAGNLVMDNKLRCNIPENIIDGGTDNNLINNILKPCEPCESPSDVCDSCHKETDMASIEKRQVL